MHMGPNNTRMNCKWQTPLWTEPGDWSKCRWTESGDWSKRCWTESGSWCICQIAKAVGINDRAGWGGKLPQGRGGQTSPRGGRETSAQGGTEVVERERMEAVISEERFREQRHQLETILGAQAPNGDCEALQTNGKQRHRSLLDYLRKRWWQPMKWIRKMGI